MFIMYAVIIYIYNEKLSLPALFDQQALLSGVRRVRCSAVSQIRCFDRFFGMLLASRAALHQCASLRLITWYLGTSSAPQTSVQHWWTCLHTWWHRAQTTTTVCQRPPIVLPFFGSTPDIVLRTQTHLLCWKRLQNKRVTFETPDTTRLIPW